MVKSILRRAPWLPATLAIASVLVTLVLLGFSFLAAGVLVVAGSFYAWGYSARGWPALIHLPRRSYGETWDAVASSGPAAAVGVSGFGTEEELRASAQEPVRNLIELAGIGATDRVLEIGCGVARIGRELAPQCLQWTGADMSANMLGFAGERLRGIENTNLARLTEVSLAPFADGSFDVVYSTNVFPHIDEMDRWRYAQEALRVLRPGGRVFIDNIGIESDAGWSMFANDAARFRELERPPYLPRYSTGAELTAYLKRAGFADVRADHRGAWVIATGAKPSRSSAAG